MRPSAAFPVRRANCRRDIVFLGFVSLVRSAISEASSSVCRRAARGRGVWLRAIAAGLPFRIVEEVIDSKKERL